MYENSDDQCTPHGCSRGAVSRRQLVFHDRTSPWLSRPRGCRPCIQDPAADLHRQALSSIDGKGPSLTRGPLSFPPSFTPSPRELASNPWPRAKSSSCIHFPSNLSETASFPFVCPSCPNLPHRIFCDTLLKFPGFLSLTCVTAAISRHHIC